MKHLRKFNLIKFNEDHITIPVVAVQEFMTLMRKQVTVTPETIILVKSIMNKHKRFNIKIEPLYKNSGKPVIKIESASGSFITIYELPDEYYMIIIQTSYDAKIIIDSNDISKLVRVKVDGRDGLIDFLKKINYDDL